MYISYLIFSRGVLLPGALNLASRILIYQQHHFSKKYKFKENCANIVPEIFLITYKKY